MDKPTFIRIVSWHVLDEPKDGHQRTMCGLWRPPSAHDPTAAEIPHGQKSCESCLRILAAIAAHE